MAFGLPALGDNGDLYVIECENCQSVYDFTLAGLQQAEAWLLPGTYIVRQPAAVTGLEAPRPYPEVSDRPVSTAPGGIPIPASGPALPRTTWSARLAASEDFQSYAKAALAAAEAGDMDAAYHLYEALAYCDDGYRAFFDRGTHRRTLDESLQWASTRPSVDMREIRRIHARCDRLKNDPSWRPQLGAKWIEKAAQADHPLAQARLAANALVEADAGLLAASEKDAALVHRNRLEAARELLRKALNSKEPAVLWKVGEVYRVATGSTTLAESHQWVWRLAACQRGFDCSTSAGWHEAACFLDPHCQPGESGLDYIRRSSGDDFSTIERQATKLNRLLDSKDSESLDLNELMELVEQAGDEH